MNQRPVLSRKIVVRTPHDEERERQREHHLKMVDLDEAVERLHPQPKSQDAGKPKKPKRRAPFRAAEGHEIALASAIKNGMSVRLVFNQFEGEVSGTIIAFDRYTVSVLVQGEEQPRIYFKSAILYMQRAGDKA